VPELPLRLLTVSNYFDTHRGGLEIVAGRLARELAGRGMDVAWAAADVVAPFQDARVASIPLKVWNGAEAALGVPWPVLSPGSVAALWRGVRDADAVLLHDSLYMTSIVSGLAARRWRRPLVVVQHIGRVPYRGALLRGLMALANRWVATGILARADQVVFISAFVRDYFGGVRFARPPVLIFNGVDIDVFRPAAPGGKAEARGRLGLDPSRPVVLFVGRFVEKKGVELLRLAAERRPGATFAFAGWGPIDPDSWGLANVRVFAGLSGSSLAELYHASDLLALPSQGEGFPLVVQEALACGLPVVCGEETRGADAAAAPLLCAVDVTGPDRKAAASRLVEAIDWTLAAQTADAACQRVAWARARYAWSAATDRYVELLRGLVGRTPGAGRKA
jgi:glycosyltransferase involved in cell wall biosynthesis